jgi:hypothetical protein
MREDVIWESPGEGPDRFIYIVDFNRSDLPQDRPWPVVVVQFASLPAREEFASLVAADSTVLLLAADGAVSVRTDTRDDLSLAELGGAVVAENDPDLPQMLVAYRAATEIPWLREVPSLWDRDR